MRPVGPVPGQLIVGAAAVSLVFLLGAATFLVIAVCCETARRARARAAARHRLLFQDLGSPIAADPLSHSDVQAGLTRLRAAIRDEQTGHDT